MEERVRGSGCGVNEESECDTHTLSLLTIRIVILILGCGGRCCTRVALRPRSLRLAWLCANAHGVHVCVAARARVCVCALEREARDGSVDLLWLVQFGVDMHRVMLLVRCVCCLRIGSYLSVSHDHAAVRMR
jgi:hypothetical protein